MICRVSAMTDDVEVVNSNTRYPPFAVTEAALTQIVSVGGRVRIDLEPGGCCGTAWSFTTEVDRADDETFGCDGAWLTLREALSLLSDGHLDYGAD